MQQTSLTSGGVRIRIDFAESSGSVPFPAILLLHGAGGNVSFWLDRIAPFLFRLNVGVYAVHFFDRTNTTRADPALLRDGVHVPLWLETIRDTLSFIRQRPGVDTKRIALVGVSLGAFLSLGLAAQDPYGIHAIVDVSGGLAPPYDAQATGTFPPTLILHGDADTIVPVSNAHALDALLTRLNVPHQVEILAGEGHWFSSASQLRILAAVGGFLSRYL